MTSGSDVILDELQAIHHLLQTIGILLLGIMLWVIAIYANLKGGKA